MAGNRRSRIALACGLLASLQVCVLTTVLPGISVEQLDKKTVDWRPLDEKEGEQGGGIRRFDDTDYAFAVADNLVFCNNYELNITFKEGVDDWGPAIQTALRKVYSKGGGTVHLPPGLLWQKTQFEIPSFCCLQGAGIDKTILKTHVDAPHFPYAGAIRTAFTTRVSMFDFTQDGNRWKMKGDPQNRFGVYTDLANYVWMKNIKVVDNMWFGFDPHGANTAWSYNLVMEDCYASGNGKDGFTIDQYYYVSMLNSVAVDNDRHGINVVSGSEYVLVKGNLVKENGQCSYTAQNNEFGTRSVMFYDNIGIDYYTAGLCLRGVTEVYAVRNKFMSLRNPTAAAIELQYAWNTKLVETEWMQSWLKLRLRAKSKWEEYETNVLPRNGDTVKEFNAHFKDFDKPPKELVNLTRTDYGTEKVDNRVPVPMVRIDPSRRKKTHDQFTDAKTNNPEGSDPSCEKGLVSGVSCCPKKCGACDESNCETLGDHCCPSFIQQDASSCDTFSAPCELSRKHTSNGKMWGPQDPRCIYGQTGSDKLCCQLSCDKCGGKGCSEAGENDMCCEGKIRKMGRSCTSYAPPCLMD